MVQAMCREAGRPVHGPGHVQGGRVQSCLSFRSNPPPPPLRLSPFCNSGSSSKVGTNHCPFYLPHRAVVRTSTQINECTVRLVDTGV